MDKEPINKKANKLGSEINNTIANTSHTCMAMADYVLHRVGFIYC